MMMDRVLSKGWIGTVGCVVAGLVVLVGCENSGSSRYEGQRSSADGGYQKSYISVKMPDRVSRLTADSKDQALKLNQYQVVIKPAQAGCGSPVTETGAYRDVYWVQVEVDGNCSYTVSASFGVASAGGSSGGSGGVVTFRKDIEPIFEEYCHECHIKGGLMEYFDSTKFDQVKGRTKQIMTSILNDNMPWKREPLSADLKEVFKSWEAGGFQEGTATKLKAANVAGDGMTAYFETYTYSVNPAQIRADRYNLGLTLTFHLTQAGQTAGFATTEFFSIESK